MLGAVALLAVAPFCVARAADVKSARVWAGPEYTRVVLDVSGPVTYKLNQDGGELTVDVNASSLASSFSSPGATGLYKGISGERQGNNVRLTARIDPSSTVKSFLLKPQADYGYRLVVDLYPGSGKSSGSRRTFRNLRVLFPLGVEELPKRGGGGCNGIGLREHWHYWQSDA